MVFYAENAVDDITYRYEHSDDGHKIVFGNIVYESLDIWENEMYPERDSEHYGDCTNVPTRCMRCCVDYYYSEAKKILEKIDG